MTHRKPKLSLPLRITAAGCIALWLLAVSCCSFEVLCSDDHHHAKADASEPVAHHDSDSDHSQEAEAAEHEPGAASHPHDSEPPAGDSHPRDSGDDSCCSTLMATAQITKAFDKPFLQPLNVLCTVLQARDQTPASPEAKRLRQAKDREWVFTPVVCLDAAHRSLAPPSLA